MDIICVVLGCDTKNFRSSDSTKLINYVFENFEYINIEDLINKEFNKWKKEHLNYFYIEKAISTDLEINLSTISEPIIPIEKNQKSNLSVDFNISNHLHAPIYRNETIGFFKVSTADGFILDGTINSNQDIYKKNVFYYLKDFFKIFPKILDRVF